MSILCPNQQQQVPPALNHLLLSAPSSGNEPPNLPTLHRLNCIPVPLDRFSFPVLFTSLDYVSIPTSYSQAVNMPY